MLDLRLADKKVLKGLLMGCDNFNLYVEQPQPIARPIKRADSALLLKEALALRERGFSCKNIAAAIGISVNQVSKITGTIGTGTKKVSAECNLIEPWKPRVIRKVYKREEVMANAILFARGKIKIGTFMKRIAP